MRGFLHGEGVFQADGQRLFHHDVNAVPGADFHDATMVIGVRVHQHGLGMRAVKHFFQVWKEQILVDAELFRISSEQRLVGFGDANDLDRRIVEGSLKKSLHMAVNQADDADTQRRPIFRRACSGFAEVEVQVKELIQNAAKDEKQRMQALRKGEMENRCRANKSPMI